MKKILMLVLMFLCFGLVFAATPMVLTPFSGGSGVPMASTSYPSRQGLAELEFKSGGLDQVTNNSIYVNDNIIGMGVYDIKGINSLDSLTLMIDVVCPTSFMFVSQTNPLFRRPFEIAVYLKYEYYTVNASGNADGQMIYNIGAGINNITLTKDYFKRPNYNYEPNLYVWFDIILSLPYDADSMIDSGVKYNNVTYPLIEDDYSAVIELVANIVEEDNGSASSAQSSLVLPFSGYYSKASSGKITSSVSMNVNMYPRASNINLNPVSKIGPRTYVDVGEFDFMYFDTTASGNKTQEIFFSASPSAYIGSDDGFLFIHNKATTVEEGYNAVRYVLRVRDAEGSTVVDFDGRNYIDAYGNIMDGGGAYCSSEDYITSKGKSSYITHSDKNFFYSTYSGIISILAEDTDETMVPGIYRSDIYIHVVDK